jgi:hypothetical protein
MLLVALGGRVFCGSVVGGYVGLATWRRLVAVIASSITVLAVAAFVVVSQGLSAAGESSGQRPRSASSACGSTRPLDAGDGGQ